MREVYLVDGTYELFRHYYAMPRARDREGREVAAVRGVLLSVLGMINGGATHIGVATDHVIESFRNRLWPAYKTGDGIDPDLLDQFQLLEDALVDLGVAVWPMIEYEADDALAAAAAGAALDPDVERVIICTPDKDLSQCVRGTRVVQMNRRTRAIRDEAGVHSRLSRARRRRGRRLSRSGGLGREIGRRCARALRSPRGDSVRRARVGRQRRQSRSPRAHARPRARPRVPVSRSRDAANRHSAVRIGRRPALDRPYARVRRTRRTARYGAN